VFRFLPAGRFFRIPERRLFRVLAILAALAVAGGVVSGVDASLRRSPQPDQEETEAVVYSPASASGSCGVERWSVKTGTDADVGKINLQSTTPTTIAALDALPAPASLPSNNRIVPTETTVYQAHATLTEFKLEADSDYHLVLVDGSGNTMIAEIPDPTCVGTSSPLLTDIKNARSEFDAKYSPTGSFQTANVPVTVTGVGFFDFQHGQTGVAPNAIELHAVLDVQFGSGTGSVTVTNPGSQISTVGTPVSLQVSATDTGGGTLSYKATGLPAGLSIGSSTGLISGTPSTAGSSTVKVTATDSTGPSGSASFGWTVSTAGGNTVTVTNPGSQAGTVGTEVSLQIHATDSASGQTLSYSAAGLPGGLSINTSTGLISGTPAIAGSNNVSVTVTDTTNAFGTASFTWTVSSGGGCTAAHLLGNPGFETGTAAPWAASTGVISDNSKEPPHSGTWDAWLDGYGTTHTDTLSQKVTVPAGCTTYQLGFWLHIDTAETTTTTAYDTLKVQVLNSSGTVLGTLATFSNLNHNTGYAQHTYNLSAYAGQAITLKLTGTEDSEYQTSFVIDDTAFNVS
jgi:hypothetical protein